MNELTSRTTIPASGPVSGGSLMIESGVQGYDIALWNGLFAPMKTLPAVVHQLSQTMLRMPKDEMVRKLMTASGQTIEVNTPDQFSKELREETALWEEGLKNVVRR